MCNFSNHSNSREAGLSVVELCIYFALTSILIASATFGVTCLLRSDSEKAIAYHISTFLDQSAINALRSQQTVTATVSDGQLKESFKSRFLNLPNEYKYTLKFGANAQTNTINFYPSGSSSAGTLVVEGDNETCVITQTISGARRVACSNAD